MRCPLCEARILTGIGFAFHLKKHVEDANVPGRILDVEWIPASREHPKASEEEE